MRARSILTAGRTHLSRCSNLIIPTNPNISYLLSTHLFDLSIIHFLVFIVSKAMEEAKAAASKFLSKSGKNDTTVHETVNPAVTNERITRSQQEEATKAVDREIHQDHYHTSVQPIQHQQVLPEEHTHDLAATQHRQFQHGNNEQVKERLAAENAQFKNTRTIGETQHTSSVAPTLTGEHIHHHVHENIQPVIEKETIQPSVVHTTNRIHEVHNNEAKMEDTTTLGTLSMADYRAQGGPITGSGRRKDSFDGTPEGLGKTLNPHNDLGTIGGPGADGTTSMTGDLDPKVGPNRGNIPSVSAQRNVANREGRETRSGTESTTAGTAGTAGTANLVNESSSSRGAASDHTSAVPTQGHSAVAGNKTASNGQQGRVHDTEKQGLMSKIKAALR